MYFTPSQTVAVFQPNKINRYNAGPNVPLANQLRHVGCRWLKFEDGQSGSFMYLIRIQDLSHFYLF